MKLVLLALTIVLGFAPTSFASNSGNRAVREIYKDQCAEAGGVVNGFCMCTEKLGLLAMSAEIVQVAVTTKKVDKDSLGVINPFVKNCAGKPVDYDNSLKRLTQMHAISSKYVKDEKILEEIRALDEAGLLSPDKFSQYLSNSKFRDQIKAKIATMKTRHSALMQAGAGKTLLMIGKERTKAHAIGVLQELTTIDIEQAKVLSKSVRESVTQSVEKAGTKSIGATLLGLGESAVKKGAKALGKGFVAAVITSTALEAISWTIGFDVTGFDPFEIAFGVTPVADGTISGAITNNVSTIYLADYSRSLHLGYLPDYVDTFTGKVALMAMIAEARSNGDSYVHFLDY